MHPVKKVVIAGGGTAGWMTAAALSKVFQNQFEITLIESEQIGTVGVGEATLPTLHLFHDLLGIDEKAFMRETQATFKLGINFENWRNVNEDYFHPFGTVGRDHMSASFHNFWLRARALGLNVELGEFCTEFVAAKKSKFEIQTQSRNYAYHLDATAYATFLRKFSEDLGVKRLEGIIDSVSVDANGDISSLRLETEEVIDGDLFIDCTGFRSLLLGGVLSVEFEEWRDLPCDSAVTVQTTGTDSMLPYTRSIAHEFGWQWKIPLQHREGNGLVFSSKHVSDDDAIARLLASVDGELLTEPKVIRFTAGTRTQHWKHNCIAIGLSSGFVEPLESTSIHMIQSAIVKLVRMFPAQGILDEIRDHFNEHMSAEMSGILDFISLHYHVTQRDDSDFWRENQAMNIPELLKRRLEIFKRTGCHYKEKSDFFTEASWVFVMLGQGVYPKAYHPTAEAMGERKLAGFLRDLHARTGQKVAGWPSHKDFIKQYLSETKQAPQGFAMNYTTSIS